MEVSPVKMRKRSVNAFRNCAYYVYIGHLVVTSKRLYN
jgi:hypothetical protein